MRAYLMTIYDTAKSFGNKAVLTDEIKPNTITLLSYNTEVAEITNGKLTVKGEFSQTTNRHINEFAQQNGFDKMTKKQILEKI